MITALADCETDGLLNELTKVHSLCITIFETRQKLSFADQPGYAPIKDGLKILEQADLVVFHNAIGFDIQALKMVYPDFQIKLSRIRDTLLMTQLMAPHIHEIDSQLVEQGKLPKSLIGSHSLEAWGWRLGQHKGDYAKEMKEAGLDPWAAWNVRMQRYCEDDVEVLYHLWKDLSQADLPQRAVELEHRFAHIISKQEAAGFPFDVRGAEALAAELITERDKLDVQLSKDVEPWFKPVGEFTPKRSNDKSGYVEGAAFTRLNLPEFKPTSRDHISDMLIQCFNWTPGKLTPTGKPKVDEDTLKVVDHPIGERLARRFIIDKRIGQIQGGSKAWLRLHKNGSMHGSMNTLGAVTGRCTHSNPNMGQVPSVGSIYGKECRALFHAPKGYLLVGADASGLELRCLAHYMAEFDGGEYGEILLNGDIHTTNQLAAGLPTRDMAKTFCYGFLYGAGDGKIGSIVGGTADDGKRLKDKFLASLPALKAVRDHVTTDAKSKGFIYGIDGRKLYIRHIHAALNTLLQSAGALLVKQATVNLFDFARQEGYQWGSDWWQAAHVHDEVQLVVQEQCAKHFSEMAVEAFRKAGRDFNWRCPIDGEAKIGRNWAETH